MLVVETRLCARSNRMKWQDLYDTYSKSGIVLALGSGVSVGCKLPMWRALLEEVCRRTSGPSLATLERAGLTFPVIASLLERRFADRSAFIKCIRDELYRNFPFYPKGYTESEVFRFVAFVQENNPSLRTVASLSVLRDKNDCYLPNPRVRSVITFNLDALFQAYILARYQKRLVRTVERATASSSPSKINVYHVHGYLRFDKEANNPKREAADAVVLTEPDYLDVLSNPTGIFTYSFLFLLREYPVIFVGLSMKDDNLRRVLYFSMKERRESYRKEGVENPPQRKLRSHFAILLRPECRELMEVYEDSLGFLGVNVLWLDSFAELEQKFAPMYESAGNQRWKDVW